MAHDLVSSIQSSSVLLVRDVAGSYRPAQDDEVLDAAQQLLWHHVRGREVLGSPQAVRDFLRVRLGGLEHEVFAVLMLDAQHALIDFVELFRGTVSQTAVYPREVVKESLARNAAAVILAHSVARHRMHLLCPESLCCRAPLEPVALQGATPPSEAHKHSRRPSKSRRAQMPLDGCREDGAPHARIQIRPISCSRENPPTFLA